MGSDLRSDQLFDKAGLGVKKTERLFAREHETGNELVVKPCALIVAQWKDVYVSEEVIESRNFFVDEREVGVVRCSALNRVTLNLKSEDPSCVFIELCNDFLASAVGDSEGDLLPIFEELMRLSAVDNL